MNLGMNRVGKIGLMALVSLPWTAVKVIRHKHHPGVQRPEDTVYLENKSIRDPTPSMILVLK